MRRFLMSGAVPTEDEWIEIRALLRRLGAAGTYVIVGPDVVGGPAIRFFRKDGSPWLTYSIVDAQSGVRLIAILRELGILRVAVPA